MVDQDFFLKFGSNAEDFARDVKQEIGGARKELGLLSKEIQNLNRASQGSPTAKLVSGIRADIKSAMGDVAKTIGQELRSALRGELKNLNIDIGEVQVSTEVGDGRRQQRRVSSTDVSREDIAAGEIKRTQKKTVQIGKDFQGALQQAVGQLSEDVFNRIKKDAAKLGQNEKAAFLALSGLLQRLQSQAKALSAEIGAQEAIAEDRGRGQTGRSTQDTIPEEDGSGLNLDGLRSRLETLTSEIDRLGTAADELRSSELTAKSVFNKTINALRDIDEGAAARLESAVFQGSAPRRVEEGPPSQSQGVGSDRLVAVGNILTGAANDMKVAVEAFKVHVNAFKNAAQSINVKVEGIVAAPSTRTPTRTPTPAAEPEGDSQAGEKAASDKTKQAKQKLAETAEENTKVLEDTKNTDRESAQLSKKERDERQKLLTRLRTRAGRANDPEALDFDPKVLESARSRLRNAREEPIKTPGPPPLTKSFAETTESAIFAGGSGQIERQVARILELTADRQTAAGSRGATERPGLSDQEATELSNLEQNLTPAGQQLLNSAKEQAGSAKQLREAAARLLSSIEAAGVQGVAGTQGTGAVIPPPGVTGFGRSGRLDRIEGSTADLPALDDAAYRQVRQFEQAQSEALREVVREAVKASLSLEEFEQVLAGLPKTLRDVARQGLAQFDQEAADAERGRIPPDFTDDREVDRARIRAGAIGRESERDERALQETRLNAAREQVRQIVGRFRGDPSGRPSGNLFQTAQRRGRDIDSEIGQTEARLTALRESLLEAQGDESSDEAVKALKDEIARLTAYLQKQQGQRAADVDVSGRTFVGERFPGGRVTPTRRDAVIEQAGPGLQQAVGGLIDIFENEQARLQQAVAQQGQRRAALASLEFQESLAGQFTLEGEPLQDQSKIDEAEATLRKIGPEIDQVVRSLERFITTPGVAEQELSGLGPEVEKIFGGRSFEELIQGRARRTTPATTLEQDRGTARVDAELAESRRIAQEAGVGRIQDLPTEEARRDASKQVSAAGKRAEAEFDKQAQQAEETNRRLRELSDVYRSIAATLERQRGPLDEGALRGRLQEEGLLGQQDLDVKALRAVAASEPDLPPSRDVVDRSLESLGGVTGFVDRYLSQQGLGTRETVGIDEPFIEPTRFGQVIRNAFSEGVETIRKADGTDREIPVPSIEETFDKIQARVRELEAILGRRPGSAQPLSEGDRRVAESELSSLQGQLEQTLAPVLRRIDANETATTRQQAFETERALLFEDPDRLIAALRELAQTLTSGRAGSPDERGARAAALRNVATEFGIDPSRVSGATTGEELLRLAGVTEENTAAEKQSESATERLTEATERMVTLYRGAPEAFDPANVDSRGARFTEDRSLAEEYADPYLYKMQVPESALTVGVDELAQLSGALRGGIYSPEQIEQFGGVQRVDQSEQGPRPEAVVDAEQRLRALAPEVAADLIQNLGGQIRGTQGLKEQGFSFGGLPKEQTFEGLLDRARAVERGGEDSAAGQIRNLLAQVAGRSEEFGSGTEITKDLITSAKVARDAMLEVAREAGATETLDQRARGDTQSRIISVLTALQGAIDKLAVCCDAMQTAIRTGATGTGVSGTRAQEVARARGTQGAENLTSPEIGKQISLALREAVAAQTPEARRRALGTAALAAKGDPSLGLDDSTVIGVLQRYFEGAVQGVEGAAVGSERLSNEDVASIKSGLLQFQSILEAGGKAAADAFKAGDITAAAEAVQSETRDVESTLSALRNAFDVTEDDVLALRPRMEQFEQGLQELDARMEATAKADPQVAQQESIKASLREAGAADFAGAPVNLSDQSDEAALGTARQALGRLGTEQARYQTFLQEMLRIYPNLSSEARAKIQTMVAEQREYAEQQKSALAFARALASVLPDDVGSKFVGAVGSGNQEVGGEVLRSLNNQGFEPSRNIRAAITQSLSPNPGEIQSSALRTVDTWAKAAQNQMNAYRTPFQNLMRGLFRGQNIVQATLSQAGFAISRFLGGSIIFSAINQMQLLGEIALETEQTFIRVQEALEATGRSADGLRTRLQDIAVDTNVSLNDTVEVMAQLVGVFETTEEALAATQVVNQLELISQGALNAREGFRSLSAVASTFQEELTGRGLSDVEAIEYLADLTVRLQDLTGVNIEDTIEGLGRLGEQANSLNIEMELLASTIGLASKATGQTGQATSEQIGRILSNFQQVDTQNLLVDLGITDRSTVQARDFGQVLEDLLGGYQDLTAAQQRTVAGAIGDPRQAAVTEAVLRRGAEALDIYEQSFNNAGAAADRTEQILNTFRGQVGQLGKQIQTFVQILVDLGILTLFGAALKILGEFLNVVNNVLQVFSNIADVSPLGSVITQAGIAIATFFALKTMVAGVVDQFLELNAVQVQGGRAGLAQVGIQAIRGSRGATGAAAEAAAASVAKIPVAIQPIIPQSALDSIGSSIQVGASSPVGGGGILQQSPLVRGARSLSGIDDVSKPLGNAAQKARDSVVRLQQGFQDMRPKLAGFGQKLKSMGPALIGGAFAIGLLIDAITRADREAREFYQGIGPGQEVQRESIDETETEAAERARRAENDAIVDNIRTLEDSVLTWDGFTNRMENAGAVLAYFGNNMGDVLDILFGAPGQNGAPGRAFDAVIGRSRESEELQDQNLTTLGALNRGRRQGTISDQQAMDAAQAIRDSNRAEYGRLIEEAPTAAVAQRLTEDFEAIDESMEGLVAAIASDIAGIVGQVQLDPRQLERFLGVLEGVEGFSSAELGRYASEIQEAYLDFIPVGAEDEINRFVNAGNFQQRLEARAQSLDFALSQARNNLVKANSSGDPDEIEEARDQLISVLESRAELDREILQAAVDLPAQFSDFAIRAGDYARAEAYLSQALQAVRQQRQEADAGSPEEADAIQREFELLREQAEAQVAEQVAALELAAVSINDPIEAIGNELEVVQARLQSAIDNPGSYTAEEIRDFIKEITELQQQVAEEQEKIADVYDEYRASNANNEIARTAIEYEGAMRRYKRALENDEGAAAIIKASIEVNEAARAQREAAEELRAATAEAQIARLPEADAYGNALANLRESFRQQAAVIKEFGRDSTEFQNTVSDIVASQRAAEQAARAVADSTLSFASSLAAAAGLDIRVARLAVQQAEAAVQRAIRDSGGDTDTAAVQQALAGLVDAQAALRDTVLGEALGTVDFMLNMEEITEQQAIQVLQQILDTADLTEDQRRDLMSRIKGLKDAINDGVNEQFNLGDIRIPTPFEVRRALKVEEVTQGVQDVVDVVSDVPAIDPPTLPGDRIPEAPAGLLEDILGPDLASEVSGLGASGGNISQEIRNLGRGLSGDLLPPLSQIPEIVNTQLASRNSALANSQQQIQAIFDTSSALNASIQQVGPTITVPLSLLHESQEFSNSLVADTNEALASANMALDLLNDTVASLQEDFRAYSGREGELTQGQQADAARLQAQADVRYRPPAREEPQWINANYEQTIINRFTGAGAQEIRDEMRKQVGPVAMQRETQSISHRRL